MEDNYYYGKEERQWKGIVKYLNNILENPEAENGNRRPSIENYLWSEAKQNDLIN